MIQLILNFINSFNLLKSLKKSISNKIVEIVRLAREMYEKI